MLILLAFLKSGNRLANKSQKKADIMEVPEREKKMFERRCGVSRVNLGIKQVKGGAVRFDGSIIFLLRILF
jgi:hypothetical protein